jgi:hypothetical protein
LPPIAAQHSKVDLAASSGREGNDEMNQTLASMGLSPVLGIVHVVIPAIVLWVLIVLVMRALDRDRW